MNLALTWASPTNPPGSAAQAVRGHVVGLLGAGHEVTAYYGDRLGALPSAVSDGAHDAVIWPSNLFSAQQLHAVKDDVHMHFHLIGVDTPGNPTAFQEALDAADSISAVDPNAATWFAERFDVDLSEIAIIPNPPNRDLFEATGIPDDGFVFAPKIGASQKDGTGLADVAELTPNVTYEAHAGNRDALPWLPFNVRVKPPVPWSRMPERYAGCAFVCNPAAHEGLPNVAYEAFCSGRAYVSRPEALGKIQSLPTGEIRPEDFGTRANWFEQQYGELYDTGQHYVTAEGHELANAVRNLDQANGGMDFLGERAREWVDAFEWSWPDTARAIVDAIEWGR